MGSSTATTTPLLPEPGKRNILITSALPYVLSADCFARFSRARGLNTLYICGSDEYGTASETKAIEEKTTPAELCSKYHEVHKRIYEDFSISFDIYGRTSTKQHTQIVQDIFTKLWDNGFIEERSTIQPYCPVHKSFLADRYIEGICSFCQYDGARGDQASNTIVKQGGNALNCDKCGKLLDPFEQIAKANDEQEKTDTNETKEEEKNIEKEDEKGTGFLINPHCTLDNATPEARSTKHLYLRLDSLQKEVRDWFNSANSQWGTNCNAITNSWLGPEDKPRIGPRSITRDLKWGVPIPKGLKGLSDEDYVDKVFYVWFDACIGYPSITKIYTDGDDPSGTNWEKWWKNPEDVTLYQFMGKDNVVFHSVIFPASQLGTRENWTKVSRFSITEYLNYERSKFSKSRNIGVFGTAVKGTGVDTDVWRFYLLSVRPEGGQDAEFLWEEFVRLNNDKLLNSLGNLCNRVLKYRPSTKQPTEEKTKKRTVTEVLEEHKKEVNKYLQEYLSHMEGLRLREGTKIILAISSLGNVFWQHNMIGNEEGLSKVELEDVFDLALNHLHLLANILCPYMPKIASSILTQLGFPKEDQNFSIPDVWTGETLKRGHKLGAPASLFTQIPARRAEEWKEEFGGDELKRAKAEKAEKAAAKKAAKLKKKEEKNAKKATEASSTPPT